MLCFCHGVSPKLFICKSPVFSSQFQQSPIHSCYPIGGQPPRGAILSVIFLGSRVDPRTQSHFNFTLNPLLHYSLIQEQFSSIRFMSRAASGPYQKQKRVSVVFRHFRKIVAGWVRVGDLHLCANPGGVGPSRAFVGPQKYEKWFEQRIPVSRKNFFRLTGIPVLWKIVFCALRIPVSRKKFFRLTGLPAPPEICNHPPPPPRPWVSTPMAPTKKAGQHFFLGQKAPTKSQAKQSKVK